MITSSKGSWLSNKFSLPEPQEICREQHGGYAYWCYGVKGSYIYLKWSVTAQIRVRQGIGIWLIYFTYDMILK